MATDRSGTKAGSSCAAMAMSSSSRSRRIQVAEAGQGQALVEKDSGTVRSEATIRLCRCLESHSRRHPRPEPMGNSLAPDVQDAFSDYVEHHGIPTDGHQDDGWCKHGWHWIQGSRVRLSDRIKRDSCAAGWCNSVTCAKTGPAGHRPDRGYSPVGSKLSTKELGENGYVGRNVAIDYRWAEDGTSDCRHR